MRVPSENPQATATATPKHQLQHACYLVLIGSLERHLNLDPCPAMKLADCIANDLAEDLPAALLMIGGDR